MKKFFIFISILLLNVLLVGCSSLFPSGVNTTREFLTRTPAITTTNFSIDEEKVISDLYKKIYDSLYDEVKQQVIDDIAEERFEQLYSSVIVTLLEEIDAGNINVSAASVIDMILAIEANQANSVLGVRNLNQNNVVQAVGSGVIYKKDGNRYYVLTNNHVVEDGTSFTVAFEDGKEIVATLRGVDELVDLAVLYFESSDSFPVAKFGDSSKIKKGELVIAVGHPSGFDYFGSMTMGIISGLNRYFDIDNDDVKDMFVGYIQHDAAINSGNSGGALFNLAGELIGVNVIKLTSVDIEGMGFAIPSNLVSAIVNDIELYGYSIQKPVLGIRFVDIKSNEAYFITNNIILPEGLTEGFYIIEVEVGKTMEDYLLPGDIVIQIGSVVIGSTTQFVEEFSVYRVGDLIDVVVIRNGETIEIKDIELKAAK
ncbi:MAG: trypsin-like peptidase domain-containing protein [Candidatus Izemoplasmatales bacterium]